MANVSKGGFRPWGTFSGGEGNYPSARVSPVANSYNTQISKYDIIIPVSDGTVAIGAAANNGLLMGVVIGCSYTVAGKRTPSDFIPASTTFTPTTVGSPAESLVEWLPLTGDLILEVDADDGTTATTLAAQIALVGENADIASPGSPSTTIGLSTMCLDISTHVTTTCNFRIIGLSGYTTEGYRALDNDPTVTRFKFLVTCNEGFLPPYTASGV